MRNFSMQDTKWSKPGAELDEMAQFCIASAPVFLTGSDREILRFYDEFKDKLEIINTIRDGKNIPLARTELPKGVHIICTSAEREAYEASRREWTDAGFVENKDFFQEDVFRPIFYLYKYNVLQIDRVEIFMTSYCSLNCEKCIAFIPYFKKRYHVPLQKLTEDMDILFSKVDYVRKLKLLGGEGLMYPYLTEYLDYIYTHYGSRVGTVRIGTNATIIPSQKIIDTCRKYGVIMDVSDYVQAVPERSRLETLLPFLEEKGVQYVVKRTGEQWLDIGYPTKPKAFRTRAAVQEHFHKCAMFCRNFYDGKFYFCCSNFAAVQSGLLEANENDYIDFRKDISKKMILEFEMGFNTLGHLTFCAQCGGCSKEANKHSVPVARQIPRMHPEDLSGLYKELAAQMPCGLSSINS